MTIEYIIVIAVVLAVALVWYVNRGKGADVNADGKVDLADVALAAKNTVEAVEEKVEEVKTEVKKAVKKTTKKPKAKKTAVDLDSLNKTQLLEHAKANGIKANASLSKSEILERIKNG